MRSPGRDEGSGTPPPFDGVPDDIPISWEDRDTLMTTFAQVFRSEAAARLLLRSIQFPPGNLPAWIGVDAEQWWSIIFDELQNGIVPEPYRRLISAAYRRYQANRTFGALYQRYLASTPTPAEPASTTCHLIVRASSDAERDAVTDTLNALGLDPREVWTTEHAVSFAVGSTSVASVERSLSGSDLGFTVVPPGLPDYLLRELFVQGPDGSRFRLVDAPAQQTLANLASDVVREYDNPDFATTERPTVIDHITKEGERERVNADQTLHEAGVADGDNLRIGFEGRAGAVNPIDRQDALDRVFKQIKEVVGTRGGIAVRSDSPTLPTEYEVEFVQDSFGPPETPGAEPSRVSSHTLRIMLGPEFPETPPQIFWLTPIFHPNVFPTYDSEQLREHPDAQGLVCLGMLADSWHPAIDFGEVVETLIAIAGYRNYELFQSIQNEDGSYDTRVNFFDRAAAQWAWSHQAEIEMIGGTPIILSAPSRAGYPNVIHSLD